MENQYVPSSTLMSLGRRHAATVIRTECVNFQSMKMLNELLDVVLNPAMAIDDRGNIDWCRWLMAGGKTPDDFTATVRRYDNATTCGLVWTADFVAYRCRTCGISPCMSLCAECFQRGNHDGHDFNMFRSQAGGACDCGDTSVMKESGFCDRHGSKSQENKPTAPAELLCVTEAAMPRIILRLIHYLRERSKLLQDSHTVAIHDVDAFLTMLNDFSAMGAAVRRVMARALTSPEIYRELTDVSSLPNPLETEKVKYMRESQRTYEDAVRSLPNPPPPPEYKDIAALQEVLVHRTFLEELVFWTVKFEFPQKVVCLLLNMLRDPDCKEALTQAFVLHYSRISMMLEKSTDPDRLSNRVVHVSVQLFSNEALALHVAEKLNLLHVMVISLRYMMRKILIRNTLHDPTQNFHYVVDCGRQVMKEHCYWPLVSDLNNVLSHRPVAVKFMSDDALLEMWFMFLSMFQGMNVNQRELSTHIEFEPNTYYAAFSAELEASAYPMWALLSHLRDASSVDLTHRVLNAALNALQDWFDNIHVTHPNLVDNLQVSFHLPLHRYLAVFMCQAINMQGRSLSDVLPPPNMLQLIMIHPLRVQVAFYEILNGLWVRNGLQIKGQAMTYIQCNFCNSMVDADLYLLQVCAMMLPSQLFLLTVLQRFHVLDWLSISNQVRSTPMSDTDSDTPMLESCLIFLASLISLRTNLGANQTRLSQLEMVTLLCMGDKTHSQLMELMPERCGTVESRDFESVLEEVAEYRAPNLEASGNMQQGMYVPKGHVWENLYDPIHVLLRAVHRREFQNSMDRFNEYVSQTGKLRAGTSAWPPYREPAPIHSAYSDPRKILKSRVFHALVWLVLFKATRWQQSVSEHVISLVVYLLEMALAVSAGSTSEQNLVCTVKQTERNVFDGDLENYFESDWLSDNLRTVINTVTLPPQAEVLLETDSDQEWEEEVSTSWRATEVDDTLSIDWIQPASIDGPNLAHPAPLVANLAHPVPLGWAGQPLALVAGTEMVPFSGGSGSTGEASGGASPSPSSSHSNVPAGGSMSLAPQSSRARFSRPSGRPGQGMQSLPPSGPPDPNRTHSSDQPGTKYRSLPWASDDGSESGAAQAAASNDATMAGMSDTPMSERPPSSSQNSSPNSDSGNQIVLAPPTQPHRKIYKHRHAPKEPNYQVELPSPDNTVEANESIISLLLKLHSHLAGVPDSFSPDSPAPDPNSRIGDGPYFVGNVLHRIMALDSLCREQVVSTREKLWPRHPEEGEEGRREREEKERTERRRRAKERQQKLMEEFASRQKQFMQRAMETDEEGMEWDGNEGSTTTGTGGTSSRPVSRRKEYDCVICNQTSPSTEDKPMGLAVLVQATSVLGHRRRNPEPACLPTSDAEKEKFKRNDTQACYFDRQVEEFNRQFSQLSWMVSVNLGWEGGVHVQTCGHHLHLDCLKSYLMSLRSQQRLSSERGEYACPLCRQMANSVLPLPPQLGEMASMVRSRPSSPSSIILELTNFLRENPPAPQQPQSNLTEAMGKAMEDMTNATYLKYKHKSHSRLPQTLFLFVSSIARTNLEIELVQRGGSLLAHQPNPLIPKRSCIVPLLHVLAVHARMLAHWPVWETWQKLAISELSDEFADLASLSSRNSMFAPDLAKEGSDMPMLLRDPTALLTQFIMLLPLHLDQTYFTCITKLLYNLLYYQVVIQMTCQMTEGQRAHWRVEGESQTDWGLHTLEGAVLSTIRSLDPTQLFSEDDVGGASASTAASTASATPTASSSSGSSSASSQPPRTDLTDKQFLEQQIQTLCLPFLRVAALLRHYMYDQPLPEIDSPSSEFVSLVYYLELVTDGMSWEQFNAAVALSRPLPLDDWLYDLHQFISSSHVAARGLLSEQHVIWHQPSLLSLPILYDRIFQYYHRKQCNQCQGVPRETSICLLCGALVCLKEACCKRLSICEAVQHSIDCGAGTAMYLVVTSSYVIVIRGKRACLWGSVYLDSFGEEDRELKRGKPLYISPGRYQLLQQQWIAHRFDHTNKKWVWHRDAL